jgi:hypothetical protein
VLINLAPQAVGDSYSTNSTLTLDVVANDTDSDGDSLTITEVSDPGHGTAIISGNKVIYTPDEGYVGGDSFTYTISDGQEHTDSGEVNVDGIRKSGLLHPCLYN